MLSQQSRAFRAVVLLPVLFLLASEALAAKHVALVIGNSAYRSGPLANPVRDARAISAELKLLNFEVRTLENATESQFKQAVDEVTRNLQAGDLCLIFYAGHGVQMEGKHYLVPIGARMDRPHQVEDSCVDVSYLVNALRYSECSLKVVIIDACRDNPFRSLTRSVRSLGKPVHAPEGTIITYSTSPGTVALDGRDGNSPFAKHFISTIRTSPGRLEMVKLLRDTSRAVKDETGQVPYMEWDLTTPDYFLQRQTSMAERQPAAGGRTPNSDPIMIARFNMSNAVVRAFAKVGPPPPFDIDQAETVTVAVKKVAENKFEPLLLAELKSRVDQEALIQTEVGTTGKVTRKKFAGREYVEVLKEYEGYDTDGDGEIGENDIQPLRITTYFCFPTADSFVSTPSETLAQSVVADGAAAADRLNDALANRLRYDLAAHVDHEIANHEQAFSQLRMTPMAGFIMPLLKADFAEVGVNLGRMTEIEIQFSATSDSDRKAISQSMLSLKMMGLGFVPGFAASKSGQGFSNSLKLAQRLLSAVEITDVGNNVFFRSRATVTSAEYQAVMGEIQRKRLVEISELNLKQLCLGLMNYYDAHKQLPGSSNFARGSRYPHSWRVAILPYIGEQKLYDQYRLNEPWDSPANRLLLSKMPAVFRHPANPNPQSTDSDYFILVGNDAVFPLHDIHRDSSDTKQHGPNLYRILDGVSNTILVVEANRSISWTRPEDISYDTNSPLPDFGGFLPGGFQAGFADGSHRLIEESASEDEIRGMINPKDYR